MVRRASYLTVAAVLLNVAASIWWLGAPWPQRQGFGPVNFFNVNILALALPIPLWRLAERSMIRRATNGPGLSGPRVAAGLSVAALAFVVIASLADDVAGGGSRPLDWLGWTALAAVAVGLVTNLRDEGARAEVAGLYVVGLCAVGWTLHQFHLPLDMLVLTGTIVLAAYGVGTSYLWSRREGLRRMGARLGFPVSADMADDRDHRWIVPANLALAAAVTVLGFGTVLNQEDGGLRFVAAQAVLAQALAVGLLARGERRSQLQLVSLCLGVVGLIAWSWSGIAPDSPSGLLDRLVAVFVSLVGTSVLYGLGLAKLFPASVEWLRAARRVVPQLLVLGASALGIVLVSELQGGLSGHDVVMSPPAVLAVGVALLVLTAAGLIAALVPGRDPLGLSERGRMGYVYACEVILGVLVIHLRLTMPELFAGFLGRYWALVVMGVAFGGVGLSEVFRRQGRLVLAEPLERSIPLLPLLPLIAALRSTPDPGQDTVFLLLTGALYTTMAWWQSRPGFGLLAILAYNGALWTVLGRWPGCGLLEHPQLWVIPLAVCTLVAAHLNRDRLAESQLVSIRYGAALAIYLASTADIMLTGVSQAPWLPLVLGGLALVGLFAGILLRARGFLFLGIGFLSLALFTMIWYAAVDLQQTWIWWACGILTGLLILTLVAVFERKRLEVLHLVDQLREWDA